MELNRRGLLAGAAALAPGLSALRAEHEPVDLKPLPLIKLGNTGIETTRLAQGTGTDGVRRKSSQVREGFESFVNLIRHAYDRGIRFYDLADQYGSHIYFREALRFIPRDEVTILTKLQFRFDSEADPKLLSPAEQRRNARRAIERFRMQIGIDVIDILLMHNVTGAKWNTELAGYLEVLSEYKEKGTIRAVGMSCHTLPALERSADLDWVEVALTRINPYGKIMDGTPDEVIPVQRKFKIRGAAVIGMKIFGAGTLVDKRDECMEFAQNLDYLAAMTLGSKTPEQIDDNIRLMQKYPVRS